MYNIEQVKGPSYMVTGKVSYYSKWAKTSWTICMLYMNVSL